jgi:hypothetical protein
MGSHLQTEMGKPDGSADGQTGYATQQSATKVQQNKHVHQSSATVLCDTVNPKA